MPSNKTSETKKQKSCSCIEYWLIRFGLEVSSRTKYRVSSIYSGFFCNKSELSSCRDLGLTVWFCLGPWFELCLASNILNLEGVPSLPHWKTCCCGFGEGNHTIGPGQPKLVPHPFDIRLTWHHYTTRMRQNQLSLQAFKCLKSRALCMWIGTKCRAKSIIQDRAVWLCSPSFCPVAAG